MSYCVNCGVELAESEKNCPLCQTEVLNPRSPWREPPVRPYPTHLDRIAKTVDRRFFATLTAIAVMIPMLITLLLDLLGGGGVSWSGYVWGALIMVFVWAVLPLYFRKKRLLPLLALDCLTVICFLFLVERFSGGAWFLRLGLPLSLVFAASLMFAAFLFDKYTGGFLAKAAWFLGLIGIFCVAVELIIWRYLRQGELFRWSLFVLIPCLTLGVCAAVLERRAELRDEIKRRLFF